MPHIPRSGGKNERWLRHRALPGVSPFPMGVSPPAALFLAILSFFPRPISQKKTVRKNRAVRFLCNVSPCAWAG